MHYFVIGLVLCWYWYTRPKTSLYKLQKIQNDAHSAESIQYLSLKSDHQNRDLEEHIYSARIQRRINRPYVILYLIIIIYYILLMQIGIFSAVTKMLFVLFIK